MSKPMKLISAFSLILFFLAGCTEQQPELADRTARLKSRQLRKSLADSISKFPATVGVAVIHVETGDTLSINNNTHFAMQSVYKLPLALKVLSEVEKGT